MVQIISIYAVVLTIIVAFVGTALLVKYNLIFKYSDNRIKRFFSRPLVFYSIRRVASAFISLFLAIAATFFLLRIDNPRIIYCAGQWTHIKDMALREMLCDMKLSKLGLDQSVFIQFFRYIYDIFPFPKMVCDSETANIINGVATLVCTKSHWTVVNFGVSTVIAKGKLITELFASTLPWSLYIGLGGLAIELFIGYPMGVFMAKYKDRLFDKLGNGYIILVGSIPSLVYYYILQMLFTSVFKMAFVWDQNPITWIPEMLTLGLGGVAGIALWVRRYMVDEFGADYVKFARSKGVPENVILFKHVLRNAAVPLVRSIPAGILYCLLGSYFVEAIYAVEGFGSLLVDSIQRKDYPLVQAVVVVSAIISICASLVGDITTAMADPRISLVKAK